MMAKSNKKTKTISIKESATKQPDCIILEKIKPDIEKYIFELTDAGDDLSKNKWSWGIVSAVSPLLNCRKYKKQKTICRKCREYLEARKRLAELIILATKF